MFRHRGLHALVAAAAVVVTPLVVACGDDDVADPPAATDTEPDAPSEPEPETPPEPEPEPEPDPETAEPADPNARETFCTAWANFVTVSFAGALTDPDDPTVGELVVLASMPTLQPQWEAATEAAPAAGASEELAGITASAAEVFSRAASAVAVADVDPDALALLGAVGDPESALADELDREGIEHALDDDLLVGLGAIDFDVDAELVGIAEPDDELIELCPGIMEVFGPQE